MTPGCYYCGADAETIEMAQIVDGFGPDAECCDMTEGAR